MKVYHLNILSDVETVNEYNRTGGDTPRFRMHRDIVIGGEHAPRAAACAYSEGEYQLVLEMPDGNCESALEVAWELTNNLTDRGWVRQLMTGDLDCTFHNLGATQDHRSSQVGDIVERQGKFFMVAGAGFTELPQLSSRNVQLTGDQS